MDISNFLLLMMLVSYSLPIAYICFYYSCQKNNSVSSVICSEQCQSHILLGMILMGIFTVLYELNRGCNLSVCFIVIILIGIYGVILIKENNNMHYVFASLVFIGIICFMGRHSCYIQDNFLRLSLYFQFVLCIFLLICFKRNIDIFLFEILLIVNFAVFYVFLHIIGYRNKL